MAENPSPSLEPASPGPDVPTAWSLTQLNRIEDKVDRLDERIREVEQSTKGLEGRVEAGLERVRGEVARASVVQTRWVLSVLGPLGVALVGGLIFAIIRLSA